MGAVGSVTSVGTSSHIALGCPSVVRMTYRRAALNSTLGWKCRRRVRDFFPPKRQTCRHVGAVSPTRHRPCWQHCTVSARWTPCRCRVGMTICQHVCTCRQKTTNHSTTILCNNQIIMATQRWLWEMAVAKWRLGRCCCDHDATGCNATTMRCYVMTQ